MNYKTNEPNTPSDLPLEIECELYPADMGKLLTDGAIIKPIAVDGDGKYKAIIAIRNMSMSDGRRTSIVNDRPNLKLYVWEFEYGLVVIYAESLESAIVMVKADKDKEHLLGWINFANYIVIEKPIILEHTLSE